MLINVRVLCLLMVVIDYVALILKFNIIKMSDHLGIIFWYKIHVVIEFTYGCCFSAREICIDVCVTNLENYT